MAWIATEGTHTITAIADLNNVTLDIDFQNNVATVAITSRNAPTEDEEERDEMTISTMCLIAFVILLLLTFVVISQRIRYTYRNMTMEDEESLNEVDVERLLDLLEKEHQNGEVPEDIYKEMRDRLESNR